MDQIAGVIQSIVFRNDDNGWTVLELLLDKGQQLFLASPQQQKGAPCAPGAVTAVGTLPGSGEGVHVELIGSWMEHREYGLQFKFVSAQTLLPDTLAGIEKYLGSGMIRGVGEATARNIVCCFGMETLDVLEKAPERIAEVKGIGVSRAQMIAESYAQQHGLRHVMMALQSFGITANQSVKLYKLYGADCAARIRQNPYRLIDDVDGIGFKTADSIAQNVGILEDSPTRIAAGIRYTLSWARNEGHTCLPEEKLVSAAAEVLGCERAPVEEALSQLILTSELLYKNISGAGAVGTDAVGTDAVGSAAVFLPYLYRYESESARKLLELNAFPSAQVPIDLEQELRALEQQMGVSLDPVQRQAVFMAFESGVLVITGGPGTGKTTIINFILMLMDKIGFTAELCAPTGRAAKRMGEATGREARTIHRLLEYARGNSFLRGEDNPLDADCIICDETSMVDAHLLYCLLKAAASGTRLIFAGDADQLPSVGAGNVLDDMISSGVLPVVRLTEIFRQAKLSRIVVNAHRINRGEPPLLDFTDDFCFEEIQSPDAILKRVTGILERGKLGDPWKDVQVLSPTKKGIIGVKNLNVQLQAALNPPHARKPQKQFGDTIFRKGDKVMQIKNNYTIEWTRPALRGLENGAGVFNGDLGTLMSIDPGTNLIEVLFDDERTAFYDYSQLEELDLAYCVSIHKSQGSEFPVVLLPLAGGPPMLMTRNLLYTAVTRARNRVVIIGRQATVQQMTANVLERKRYSALATVLRELSALFK